LTAFDSLPEQAEAKRLLAAALAEGPAHAYLFHGPAGVGKRALALAFGSELLGGDPRVGRRTHPDLYVLEPLGEQIRIDAVREMRRDLHMRPFEADRRVYLILDAHLLRDESANALLKSLEDPPEYGVLVLVSDHAERMLPTIRSRLQAIEFRRYPKAVLEAATGDPLAARAALGDLARATSLATDPAAAGRRRLYLELAQGVRSDSAFDPSRAGALVMEASNQRAKAESELVAGERDARSGRVTAPKAPKPLGSG